MQGGPRNADPRVSHEWLKSGIDLSIGACLALLIIHPSIVAAGYDEKCDAEGSLLCPDVCEAVYKDGNPGPSECERPDMIKDPIGSCVDFECVSCEEGSACPGENLATGRDCFCGGTYIDNCNPDD